MGVVTSGTQTPFLKKAIGMAYVPASVPADAEIAIDIRNRRVAARLVPLPFYKRPEKVTMYPETSSTPRTTSGFAFDGASGTSASPISRRSSSGTSSTSSCPRSARL